jgi:hypothetical protein
MDGRRDRDFVPRLRRWRLVMFVFPPLPGWAKFFRAYGACDLFRDGRRGDEWRGEWGGRVLDAPLLIGFTGLGE